MKKEMIINVKNNLLMEMRYLNVYRSTRSAHILSYDSSQALPLGTDGSGDYINISSHSGPGYCVWSDCLVNIPAWANFEFLSEGKVTLIHEGERTMIKIPAGPPTWQLRLIRPTGIELTNTQDYVVVTDDREEGNPGGEDG